MRFLCIDSHIAVANDMRFIFNNLGHTVTHFCLSGHAPLVGVRQARIPELDGDSWCTTIQQNKQDDFYDKYVSILEQYDAFICCYPPVFSTLFRKSKKPIIMNIPIRYEHGVQNDAPLWEAFNTFLREGVDSKRITLIANNKYDALYAEGFINRPVRHISSLCEYTGMSYNPVRPQFIYYASSRIPDAPSVLIKKHDALHGGHSWQSVSEFKGVLHFPYNISTMSLFEQYTANIPVFFPSQRLLLELYENKMPGILDQISWNRADNRPAGSLIRSYHACDPNKFDDYSYINYWLQFADFYNKECMRNIQYFDNESEMYACLNLSLDQLLSISASMHAENVERKAKVYKLWEEVLNGLSF